MNLNRILLPLGLVMCGLLSSCIYPYPPNPHGPVPAQSPDPATHEPELDPIEVARREAQEAADRLKNTNPGVTDPGNTDPGGTSAPDPVKPPEKEYRVAVPIPGKPGFVFNPFTNKPLDVRGIPAGKLVVDPNDPDPNHKFRVP